MKAKLYVSFLFVILFLSFSSAVDFTIKEKVLRGENLIVKVSGTFVQPLTKDNIYFYQRHLSTSIEPYGVEKIDGDYYIYAQVPFEKEVDNYSIWLKDVEYNSGIGTSTEDLFANFTILESYAPFSLNPGIIQASENYSIEIKSLSDSTIIVNYGEEKKGLIEINESVEIKKSFLESLFGGSENTTNTTYKETTEWTNSVELKPGETKTLEFPIESFVGLKKVRFNYEDRNYDVLVFMDGTDHVISEVIEEEENVIEEGEENESSSEKEINVTVLDNGTIIVDNNSTGAFAENCSVLDGIVCEQDFKCEGDIEYTKVDVCCLGECVEKETNNKGKTIGWILIIAIVLFLTWFFKKKYRGAKPPPIDLEKVSKGKRKELFFNFFTF